MFLLVQGLTCSPFLVQVGTIDAILAQLCIRYELRLVTTDADFARIAEDEPLERWTP